MSPAASEAWLRGATVLVTGATGLVGSSIVHALADADTRYDLGLTVLAQGRSESKGRALARTTGATFLQGDVREAGLLAGATGRVDIALHCAANTRSADMVARPEEVTAVAVEGTRSMLEQARALGCRSFVYLSSMEAYGQAEGEVSEDDLGPLDPSSPRSSYPLGKRLAEQLCRTYADDDFRVTVARLGLTFGAGVPDDPADTRVALQFARAARAGRDIELHTQGLSMTNAVETSDAVRALLLLAERGERGQAYNIANPAATMSIRAMAEVVARDVAGGAVGVVVNVPDDLDARGYAPPSGYRLNVDRIRALGWEPRYGMTEMFRRMLDGWGPAEERGTPSVTASP